MAAQGKPVVIPGVSQSARKQDGFAENVSTMSALQTAILKETLAGD